MARIFEWEEGMTVRRLLELKKYAYPRIMVKINGEFVRDEEFDTRSDPRRR